MSAEPSGVRERILDAALELMGRQGASATSMRRLATESGVQVAAIYHYFASKGELLDAVVAERQYGSRLLDPLPIDAAAPPEERLRQLFMIVWAGALEEASIWRLLLGEALRGEEAVMPTGRALVELLEPAFSDWIRSAVPEVADPDLAASVMMSQMLSGFVRHAFEPPTDADADVTGKRCADLVVDVCLRAR